MRIKNHWLLSIATAGAVAAACGGGSSSGPPSTGGSGGNTTLGYYLSITNLTYSPLNLEAPPGATVTVINNDGMDHSVTSQAMPLSYVHNTSGISFDTGPFTGTTSFVLPQTAPAGTVVNYFCRVHLSTMNTPNGTITVNPNAAPSEPPASMPSGYSY